MMYQVNIGTGCGVFTNYCTDKKSVLFEIENNPKDWSLNIWLVQDDRQTPIRKCRIEEFYES